MKVLVATDGSDLSVHAARRALPLLGRGAEVTVLAVLSEMPGDAAGGVAGPKDSAPAQVQEWQDETRAAQEAIRATAAEVHGPNAVTRVEAGDAGRMIVWVAADIGADVVVMGSHGRSALRSMMMGSVSRHVLQHAPCPVLVVRE